MISICLLFALLVVTSWTDIREGKIYNWTTYPGILLGLSLNLVVSVFVAWEKIESAIASDWIGCIGGGESFLGLIACGGAMLVCYVFFAGKVGGGDIKLIAMMGAYLGVMDGLEAMLWAFVIAATVAIVRLIWQLGIVECLQGIWRPVAAMIRFRTVPRLTADERKPLQAALCLSPSALAGFVIVKFDDVAVFLQSGI